MRKLMKGKRSEGDNKKISGVHKTKKTSVIVKGFLLHQLKTKMKTMSTPTVIHKSTTAAKTTTTTTTTMTTTGEV